MMHPQRSTNEVLLKTNSEIELFIAFFLNIKDVPSLLLWTGRKKRKMNRKQREH